MSGDALLAADSGCHLNSGCGFPAPDATIFNFDPIVQFDVAGLSGPVQRATLRLYAYDGSNSGGSFCASSISVRIFNFHEA